MPKGVEHYTYPLWHGNHAEVRSSLMPKGVEHRAVEELPDFFEEVRSSLMPKGVEHSHNGPFEILELGEIIFDAERR